MLDFILNFIKTRSTEIIAISAMIITVYQSWITRHHNRLSVVPHLTSSTDRFVTPQSAELSVRLINKGLGPAIIEEFAFFLDGKACNPDTAVELLLGAMNEKCMKTVGQLKKGSAMSANEEKVVLCLHFPIEAPDDVDQVFSKMERLDLLVRYKSMYGKQNKYDSREKC